MSTKFTYTYREKGILKEFSPEAIEFLLTKLKERPANGNRELHTIQGIEGMARKKYPEITRNRILHFINSNKEKLIENGIPVGAERKKMVTFKKNKPIKLLLQILFKNFFEFLNCFIFVK